MVSCLTIFVKLFNILLKIDVNANYKYYCVNCAMPQQCSYTHLDTGPVRPLVMSLSVWPPSPSLGDTVVHVGSVLVQQHQATL